MLAYHETDKLLLSSAFLAFLPIPITAITLLTRPKSRRPEKFGIGRYRTKLSLLLFTSFLLSLGASFRVGVNYTTPRPINQPAWYHSKACFYCFNFLIELVVVYAYIISRFDRRFHVPNGSYTQGHYSGARRIVDDDASSHRRPSAGHRGYHASSATLAVGSMLEVNRESDVFGSDSGLDSPAMQKRRQSEWETNASKALQDEADNFPSAA